MVNVVRWVARAIWPSSALFLRDDAVAEGPDSQRQWLVFLLEAGVI